MNRRDLLRATASLAAVSLVPLPLLAESKPASLHKVHPKAAPVSTPLKPPDQGSIPVAFLISDGAVVIDFCGPWEVFQDVSVPGRHQDAFQLYTVAETLDPIHASAGLKIVPDFTFANAPAPKVIVIPAQGGQSDAALNWIRTASQSTDVTMSVCTGALLLARTGLLSGKPATTHHTSLKKLGIDYPDITVKRGARFTESGNIATAAGLSSGIDLALHVVQRYFGPEVAKETAYQMEYQGQGWMNPDSNQLYARVATPSKNHFSCPVCEMEVQADGAPKSVFKNTTYYFCSDDHKKLFDAAPEKYLTK